MTGRLDLDRQGQPTAPDAGQQFFAGLNGSLCPAMLLRFETVHVHRQFRRCHHVGKEDELPAPKLRAIAEIEILGQSVVLPTTGLFDARFAPETGGAGKIKKKAAPAARDLLQPATTYCEQ